MVALLALASPALATPLPVEDYAPYEPQTTCRTKALPGTTTLTRWINNTYRGGTARASLRACSSGGTSEHKDGRAIDWTMSATSRADRRTVNKFLNQLFVADAEATPHALARRMGVMYVIWNDRIWSSYRQFAARDYLSSGCTSRSTCSRTLRHRDHVHISVTRKAARGNLSYTHQREHVEAVTGAKRPETRDRRIARIVAGLTD